MSSASHTSILLGRPARGGSIILLVLSTLGALACASPKDASPPAAVVATKAPDVTPLGADLTLFRDRFDRDRAHPRLVMLLSPT